MPTSFFRFIIPSLDNETVQKLTADVNNQLKMGDTDAINFEWDGDNVIKISSTYQSLEYTYDNKLNPYKNLFHFVDSEEIEGNGETTFASMCSKNNVVKEVYTEDGDMEVIDYTYTYDGKFPATKTLGISYHETYEGLSITESYSMTWYYEYK